MGWMVVDNAATEEQGASEYMSSERRKGGIARIRPRLAAGVWVGVTRVAVAVQASESVRTRHD